MGGETIVSKVQGEQNKSPGGQSTPWLPLRSAYAHRAPFWSYAALLRVFSLFIMQWNMICFITLQHMPVNDIGR